MSDCKKELAEIKKLKAEIAKLSKPKKEKCGKGTIRSKKTGNCEKGIQKTYKKTILGKKKTPPPVAPKPKKKVVAPPTPPDTPKKVVKKKLDKKKLLEVVGKENVHTYRKDLKTGKLDTGVKAQQAFGRTGNTWNIDTNKKLSKAKEDEVRAYIKTQQPSSEVEFRINRTGYYRVGTFTDSYGNKIKVQDKPFPKQKQY